MKKQFIVYEVISDHEQKTTSKGQERKSKEERERDPVAESAGGRDSQVRV